MDDAEKDISRFGMCLFYPLLDGLAERFVAGLVALDNLAGPFVDDDDVVVFVDYFHYILMTGPLSLCNSPVSIIGFNQMPRSFLMASILAAASRLARS